MSINPFKTGDKVVCINNRAYESTLTVGKEYEVQAIPFINDESLISIRNNKGSVVAAYHSRFKLAEEEYPQYYTSNTPEIYAYVKRITKEVYELYYKDGRYLGTPSVWVKSTDEAYRKRITEAEALACVKPSLPTPTPEQIRMLSDFGARKGSDKPSIPATEHSVVCAALGVNPDIPVSVVIDSYDYWGPLKKINFLDRLLSIENYLINEPIINTCKFVKGSFRYVFAYSLIVAVGCAVFAPKQTQEFVAKLLPKVNISFQGK